MRLSLLLVLMIKLYVQGLSTPLKMTKNEEGSYAFKKNTFNLVKLLNIKMKGLSAPLKMTWRFFEELSASLKMTKNEPIVILTKNEEGSSPINISQGRVHV